ncbi:XYLOSE ABC TRANSPORTER ATP-BINDING PROTEIN [Mycoplasmopsis pulmonis]|uniref:XYLOSE ABC TRANSPORTER ATP-BINDING PROTEIN n=1 Tax=Mycoplasmopsis pulmonis (strain UAB CTIP) TaxID=272635 RepID=Q98QL7_MYCPU|nr:sugar ABC transporter ATP-binding protein [Mycoplasmopsis pulmonis]MDZ7293302.1 sugar ABC transporter ATP-binding protein [Mycoplasmopsis pulmonis]CAC13517.1 XYLOSE ABC TRANSPORTER ATP-BINDING PROTEIN [Mycoplasmopsis pulmonis]VEU68107.1 xylose ABC transporter ATB-binding protein [Mycoplasmopsis pulmonis]
MNTNEDVILELKNVTKVYPGVVALNNVSFKVKRKSILSLVGENGAGKSTILKVISGVIPNDKFDGAIFYNGIQTNFSNLKQSEKAGIAIIHQELAISPHLSLYENIFLGNYEAKHGLINRNEMIKKANYYLHLVGLKKNPDTKAGTLSIADQQLLEIAKALAKKAKLLILDEPTSSLNDKDSYALLDIMKRLRDEEGITCIFVSHKLKEVAYVADYITIIRDGKHISDYSNSKEKTINEATLIKDIVGRDLESKFPEKPAERKIGKIKLEVEKFQVENPKVNGKLDVINASFNVREGEIVGISGLVGSGRSELAMSIFGNAYGIRKNGNIKIDGKIVNLKTPLQAIKNGLMYASEDRKNVGLIQMFSIHWNISSAASHIFSNKFGILKKEKETQNSSYMRSKVNIKAPSVDYLVETLSGGNQQKVLIAKALTTNFDILIIDEPTKGIDVGSKYEIYKILLDLASEGKAIVVISSELEELLGITDRIFVMSQGIIKGELPSKEATPEKVMQIAIGTKQNERSQANVQ